ncbi:MAG: cation:proton antiporter [Phycisphaerae bacterium]|nr:MAG: cation:proton antiporter [Planctomycetota bacterium]KAB2948737.1 MAG: cation:proton antiporter [Phycisphaerae bacterium]MBE7456812.1 cation:proton antiporter [Planctomycetia bacterium]MCK6464261.1 cation:proton antiporter [Phycisphaerae bacterium]MCL4717852.1 cation:proton antiporter [Phycisphaerae bacterium]
MDRLSHHDVMIVLLSLGVLLLVARTAGELARRLNQPAVLGEILAGIALGATGFGRLFPNAHAALFPSSGPPTLVLHGIGTVGVVLFLLVAGMEVDLSTIWRQGRTAATVSLMGIVIPFGIGWGAAQVMPELLGLEPGADRWVFSLFLGTALAISALPVIARTLMDLDLYRTDFGMLVIAAAIVDDLVGWMIFALLLAMIGAPGHGMSVGWTVLMTLGLAAFVLTIGRWGVNRTLPWLQAHTSWPGGVLGFALSLALFFAALTEWIGIHAVFGAFLVGVALGDSVHLREQTRATIERFVASFFAPLFFATIGLRIDFIRNFEVFLSLLVVLIACAGKVLGCALGARITGTPAREAWAIGFGLNARGAMEIILGLLALQAGLIGERLFVSLVFMALITSVICGPAVQKILGRRRVRRFVDYLVPKAFVPRLVSTDRREVISELCRAIAPAAGRDTALVEDAVWNREQTMSTGLEQGLAIPHARIPGLAAPLVGLGLSFGGVDFDAYDGEPARIIVLILTPEDDRGVQVNLLADIARTLKDPELRTKVLHVTNATELLALIRTEAPPPA